MPWGRVRPRGVSRWRRLESSGFWFFVRRCLIEIPGSILLGFAELGRVVDSRRGIGFRWGASIFPRAQAAWLRVGRYPTKASAAAAQAAWRAPISAPTACSRPSTLR